MPIEVYSRREMALVAPPESPIEERMAEILEDGLGTGCRAVFSRATSVEEARRAIEDDLASARRHPLMVVPQPAVGRYRPDYLVIATAPGEDPAALVWADRAFLVECDGEEFHGAPKRIAADRAREREIRLVTGLEVVRFSGAEINFASGAVSSLLELIVDLRMAVQAHPGLGDDNDVDGMRRRLARMTALPARRQQHVGRNSRPPADDLDPWSAGTIVYRSREGAAADIDDMDAVLSDRAHLRYRIAAERRAWAASSMADLDEEPGGDFRHIGHVMDAVMVGLAEAIGTAGV